MMELPATFSKSNYSGEYAAWMPTITLGKDYVLREKSLQLVEPTTGSTCTYGTIANVSANPTIAHQFIPLQYLTDYERYLLDAVTETRINSRYGLSEQLRGSLGYPGVQIRYRISDLPESSWMSTRVILEEEELETIHADTNQSLSFRDLVSALDRISCPTEKDDVPLPLDPVGSGILQRLWNELAAFPKLADVAEIQRGLEYPFLRNDKEIFSEAPDDGFVLGLSRVGDEIEPYIAKPSRYLNMDPKVLRGKDLQEPWQKPKVIANAVGTDVERWLIVGALDEEGLVCTQDFYGIWPTGSLPIEVLAALINSPIVNAFLSTHAFSEHNHKSVLQRAPIPNFTKADIHLITSLVRNYRATRERWLKEPGGNTGRGILRQLDWEILGLYHLSMQVERNLLAYFEGYKRPGSIPLTQVEPSHENRLWKTMLRVEEVLNEDDDMIVGVFVYGWEGGYPDKVAHFPLSIVPQELRKKIVPNTTLRAKVNVGTAYEKDLVFEDIEIMPGVSEEFRARFA